MPTTIRRSVLTLATAAAVTLAALAPASGCVRKMLTREPSAAAKLEQAPPVRLDTFEGRHMAVMQAPHAGWNIRLDGTHKTQNGKRVYLTIRRPDPVLMYPQRIVLKRVLTQVDAGTTIDLVARVLEHDEKAKKQEYAPLTPVESFGE